MISFSRFSLPNGLRVIHNYDPSTAMVAVNILYNVGSRDESPELTGLAHLFEHLMFGGSVNIPDFDAELQRAGGKSNAFTSKDFTNFYDILPAQNAETAFWLESDRMLQLAFSDKALEVQRSVVIEEFKQTHLNKPYGEISHLLFPAAFNVHPYSWPVIGKEISHIERVTQDDVRQFFFSHYAPNNAVLSVSGNITLEHTRELAEKWFGDIPARETALRLYPTEPQQIAPRLIEAKATLPVPATSITIAYRMDGYGTEQFYAADLITDLLADGHSSRFYRKLMMESGDFCAADASILGYEEPGLLILNGRLTHSGEEAEQRAIERMLTIVDELKEHTVEKRELVRAVNRRASGEMFESISYLNKAIELARAEFHGEDINDRLIPYRSLTPDDLRRQACEIFRPENSTTLIYR